jgi:Protein of unknown function (DUF1573)
MSKTLKIILLTVLTLSVFTLVIIELTGISRYSLLRPNRPADAELYSPEGRRYHGEIYPEDIKTCDETVKGMLKTTMQFYETKYNFGPVAQGKVVSHSFHFKNTGQHPLLICKADVTCGCTVPYIPHDPIAPGSEGEITIEFNSAGKLGIEDKSIIVHSNAMPEAVSIGIEADVK